MSEKQIRTSSFFSEKRGCFRLRRLLRRCFSVHAGSKLLDLETLIACVLRSEVAGGFSLFPENGETHEDTEKKCSFLLFPLPKHPGSHGSVPVLEPKGSTKKINFLLLLCPHLKTDKRKKDISITFQMNFLLLLSSPSSSFC